MLRHCTVEAARFSIRVVCLGLEIAKCLFGQATAGTGWYKVAAACGIQRRFSQVRGM